MTADQIRIFEVGPRDGLQNEKRWIETKDKVALIDKLSQTGLKRIEATAFVSPKWVPQMKDAAAVMSAISRIPGTLYSALTPNLKGYEAAKQAGVDEIAVFAAASEGFSQNNINCSIDESLARFAPVMEAASADGIPVRGYVSCVIACPYDGRTDPIIVSIVSKQLLDMGCYEVSLGDTIGAGDPKSTRAMLDAVLNIADADQLAGHYHDTGHAALANIEASIDMGLRCFDAAIGGLGGCPYAPGAPGNVATERVAELAKRQGFETGLDPKALAQASEFALSLVR